MKKLNLIALGVAMISVLNTTPLYALAIEQPSENTTIYLTNNNSESITDGNAIISIPSSIELHKDYENDKFTNTTSVYVYGEMNFPNAIVSISVPTTTTFTNENSDNYTGNITFGTNGFYGWDYDTMKNAVNVDGSIKEDSLDKQDFTITVDNASTLEEGVYTSTVTFQIEVVENPEYQNYIKTEKGIIIDGKLWSYTPTKYLLKSGYGTLYLDPIMQIAGVNTMVINNHCNEDSNFDRVINYCTSDGKVDLYRAGNTKYEGGLNDETNNGVKTVVTDIDTTCLTLGDCFWLENLYLTESVRVLGFTGVSDGRANENLHIYYYGSAVNLFMSLAYGKDTIRQGDTTPLVKYYSSTVNSNTSNTLSAFSLKSTTADITLFESITFYYWDEINGWTIFPTEIFVNAYCDVLEFNGISGSIPTITHFENFFPIDADGTYETTYKNYLANYGI